MIYLVSYISKYVESPLIKKKKEKKRRKVVIHRSRIHY